MLSAETIIRRDMDFLLVAVELTVPVLARSVVGDVAKRKAGYAGLICEAKDRRSWTLEPSGES